MQRSFPPSPPNRVTNTPPAVPALSFLMPFLVGLLVLLASACGKRGTAESKDTTKSTSATRAPNDAPRTALKVGSDTSGAGPDAAKEGSGALATELTFSPAQVQHGGVRWASITMGTASGRALVPGVVIPNEDRTVRLGAPATGRIMDVRVQLGDPVSRGRVMVTLQSPDAGTAQADVAKATAEQTSALAQARYADAARARAQRLLVLKAIPEQDYELAVARAEEALAARSQAESELARATSAARQLGAAAISSPGEILIRAPMRGVVLARSAIPGTVVDAGAPLVVITDPSTLWLSMSAPAQFSSLFSVGDSVRFTVPAFPADTFTARIDAVGAGLDPATRTLPVRGTIRNGREKLKPEMLASVVVEGGTSVPAALVPQDAVQFLDGKPNVFVAQPDGKGGVHLERREVEVGSRSGGSVAVTRGLAAGDVVVVAGAFAVKAQFTMATLPKEEN